VSLNLKSERTGQSVRALAVRTGTNQTAAIEYATSAIRQAEADLYDDHGLPR